MINPIAVLEQLKDRSTFGLIEAYHVSTFKGHRHKQDGSTQAFTLTILDAGPTLSNPMARYTSTIETDDGRKATGNPSESVLEALYILQNIEMEG